MEEGRESVTSRTETKMRRERKGRRGTRGPGWRIVRSIVRLLYLVPSFCGSLSHPSLSFISLSPVSREAHLRVRRARSSRSCSYSCFLSSSLFSPTSPPSRHLLAFLSSLFVFYLSPLCTYPLLFWARFHCQPPSTTTGPGAVTSSSPPPRVSERKRGKEMGVQRERERERDPCAYTRVRVATVIYTRGPQIRSVDRSGFVGGASDN